MRPMKLRLIILLLSLLAFASAMTGGFLHYLSIREAAHTEARQQTMSRAQMLQRNIGIRLSQFVKPVETLAGLDDILEIFLHPSGATIYRANAVLDLFKRTLNCDVCYLMNYRGDTIASSNRQAPDSFVGKNFAFRPYFQQAFHQAPAIYLAMGITSGKRGAYFSYPVFERGEDTPIGLAVIKVAIDEVEHEFKLADDELVLITSPQGVIFVSSRDAWRYQTIDRLTAQQIDQIAQSRQFGTGPWPWSGLTVQDHTAVDAAKNRYQVRVLPLDYFNGWHIYYMKNRASLSSLMAAPLLRLSGAIVMLLCVLMGVLVFFLYHRASKEIIRRKSVQKDLRESRMRYRSLYHKTPAMLHSIDMQGRLLSVSDYWTDVMGYARNQVIGKNLTDFLMPASRQHARQTVFPKFFQSGVCKDIAYQFKPKTGEPIDVLLSAVTIEDDSGRPLHSLAVSIDVTQRLQAERALKQAKADLDRHLLNLEAQVRKRTREISGILRYSPGLISIKDVNGRYKLINTRYETILGKSTEQIRGQSDAAIFSPEISRQLRLNDQRVIASGRSCQVEERLPLPDGFHTYLSVKFPIFNASHHIQGICSISTDITELKKTQNLLRRLSASIMDSQETERKAIARELHDELGQVLSALRMEAVWLQNRLERNDSSASKRAATMCQLIDKNIEDVRHMAIRLRPGVLDDLGLVDALEWYTTDFEKRSGITCMFRHPRHTPTLAPTVATAAYRIVQETLTNALRHAHANHCEVVLDINEHSFALCISDNGAGFNPDGLAESEGLGIAGMRERAMLVGGQLTIDAKTGQGTAITLDIPLEHAILEPRP